MAVFPSILNLFTGTFLVWGGGGGEIAQLK